MARKFVVNPLSITYEQIQNELRVLIASNQNTFTDFFNDGSGSSVVDLAASLGAFFAYHIISQRKEFTLEQAVSYKSLIGNAYDKGYNVTRGKNLRLLLSVTPDTTGSLATWTTIGSYDEYDIVLMQDINFTAGVPITMEVVLGNRQMESKIITTDKTTIFRFTSDDVTDDVRLLLNGSELPYSTNITDLLNDKYLLMTNSYGSVNAFYLQNGKYKYKTSDTILIDYIARNTVDISSVSVDGFYISGFTVTAMAESVARTAMEDKDNIRVGASLHAETSGIIKARGDFKKVLREMDDTIASTNDFDIQPGRIGVTVLKKDLTALTDSDKAKYSKIVSGASATGVANTMYTDAHLYEVPMTIYLTSLDSTTTSASLVSAVQAYLEKYQYELGKSIDFYDIENYVESKQSNIKTARITVDSPTWSSRTYRISDSCIPTKFEGKAYYVANITYRTGSTTPKWTTLTDGYVVDNQILWKEYSGDPEGVTPWKANIAVVLGKLVVDQLGATSKVYECVGYVARTGQAEPDWSKGESIIFDNQIVWAKVSPEKATLSSWKANSLLQVGKVIHKVYNSALAQSYENKTQYIYYGEIFGGTFYAKQPLANSVECFSDEEMTTSIGVAGNYDATTKTVTITPISGGTAKTGTFEDYTVYQYLGGTTGTFYTKTILTEGTECYADSEFQNLLGTAKITGSNIQITGESDIANYYYKVADYAAKSSTKEPDWSNKALEGYIEDGQILWRETNYPVRFIQLDSNAYAKFDTEFVMES